MNLTQSLPIQRKKIIQLFLYLFYIVDIILVNLSFFLAYLLRFYSGMLPQDKGIPPFLEYFKASITATFIWVFFFYIFKMYVIDHKRFSLEYILNIFKGVAFGLLFLMAFSFLYRGFSYSRAVLFLATLLLFLLEIIFRYILFRVIMYFRQNAIGIIRALIFGANTVGEMIIQRISMIQNSGYEIVGFVDDRKDMQGKTLYGKTVMGTSTDLNELIKKHNINEVIIVLPSHYHNKILNIISSLDKEDVQFSLVPDLFDIIISRTNIVNMEGIPFISMRRDVYGRFQKYFKSAFDFIFALLALMLILPLLVVIALIIKLTSRGPVLYKQERIGINGKPFNIYKFRSMRTDAEQSTGPIWAYKEDPRKTAIGSLLRKLSIDELPQFFNVLKGDMSIVGPRPERPFFVERFQKEIPRYMDRHRVKTGITGWAQINGLRGNTSIEERTKYDLYYIENWSLLFDIRIILRTIFDFFTHKDAY